MAQKSMPSDLNRESEVTLCKDEWHNRVYNSQRRRSLQIIQHPLLVLMSNGKQDKDKTELFTYLSNRVSSTKGNEY